MLKYVFKAQKITNRILSNILYSCFMSHPVFSFFFTFISIRVVRHVSRFINVVILLSTRYVFTRVFKKRKREKQSVVYINKKEKILSWSESKFYYTIYNSEWSGCHFDNIYRPFFTVSSHNYNITENYLTVTKK